MQRLKPSCAEAPVNARAYVTSTRAFARAQIRNSLTKTDARNDFAKYAYDNRNRVTRLSATRPMATQTLSELLNL